MRNRRRCRPRGGRSSGGRSRGRDGWRGRARRNGLRRRGRRGCRSGRNFRRCGRGLRFRCRRTRRRCRNWDGCCGCGLPCFRRRTDGCGGRSGHARGYCDPQFCDLLLQQAQARTQLVFDGRQPPLGFRGILARTHRAHDGPGDAGAQHQEDAANDFVPLAAGGRNDEQPEKEDGEDDEARVAGFARFSHGGSSLRRVYLARPLVAKEKRNAVLIAAAAGRNGLTGDCRVHSDETNCRCGTSIAETRPAGRFSASPPR